MNKHYTPLDPTNDIDTVPSLPDRSDLSKLYPEAKGKTTVTEAKVNILDDTELPKTVGVSALKIGLLIPAPFLIGMIPAVLLVKHVTYGNIFQLLPVMTLTMIVWGIVVVLTFTKVSRLLDRLSISPFTLLCLHISCMVLVAPAIYSIVASIGNVWLALTLFSLATTGLSIMLCWLSLQLILNDRITKKSKLLLITTIVVLCLSGSIIHILLTA